MCLVSRVGMSRVCVSRIVFYTVPVLGPLDSNVHLFRIIKDPIKEEALFLRGMTDDSSFS